MKKQLLDLAAGLLREYADEAVAKQMEAIEGQRVR